MRNTPSASARRTTRSQIEHLWSAFVWQEYMTKSGMTEFARALNQSQGRNLDLLDEDMDVDAYHLLPA